MAWSDTGLPLTIVLLDLLIQLYILMYFSIVFYKLIDS